MSELIEVVVGVIGRPHGIHGDVVVDVRTDEPERRFAPDAVLRGEADGKSYTVTRSVWHGQRLLVRFAELADRTAVEQARGTVLVAQVAADATPDDPEEYYDHQLVGLRAVSGGTPIGTVSGVLHLEAQDLLVLDTGQGERLVPFVSALVPRVDLGEGLVEVVDLPGLLHDDEPPSGQD